MSSRHPDSGGTRELIKTSKQIEKEIIVGTILDDSDFLSIPEFRFRPNGWDSTIELKNTSSMVSELAPVVCYLRRLVDTGDVLIIEEPESHLHPSAQVRFLGKLVDVVNAGVQVIVTTHSEWIMEALAKHVSLSSLSESRRSEIGGENSAIQTDMVGAWLFTEPEHSEDSSVEEIRLDDSRLYPTGFEKVATALHNDWVRITRHLPEDYGQDN